MSKSINLTLNENDIAQFKDAMRVTHRNQVYSQAEIILATETLIEKLKHNNAPDFVRQRLYALQDLITMLSDHAWRMDNKDKLRIYNALAYVAQSQDLIPDDTPVFGLIDDAVAIEICLQELGAELDAYQSFCEYRMVESLRRGMSMEEVACSDWLQKRRNELIDGMQRGERLAGFGYGSSTGYGRNSYTEAQPFWRTGSYQLNT